MNDIIDAPFIKFNSEDFPRPWLPITIRNPHTNQETRAYGLIDTGADECAIPADFATMLGHNLQAGATKEINTGNGITNAYAHTVCIETACGLIVENVLIDFLPNLKVVLLGVKSFLSNFTVTVDYKNQKFSLVSNRKTDPAPAQSSSASAKTN